MKILLAVVGFLALMALIIGGAYVSSRNEMVRKNETIKQAWSQVDVVLQRRADLIPNLVATVKGYAQQEVKVFGDVADARAALLSARTPADKIADFAKRHRFGLSFPKPLDQSACLNSCFRHVNLGRYRRAQFLEPAGSPYSWRSRQSTPPFQKKSLDRQR